jgi:hypothetical protein
MSVASPAIDAWHRKLVGEGVRLCLEALKVYEDMPCYCFLGHPPRVREPCVKGHCPNINGMPREVMDVLGAYANRRAELEDIEELCDTRKCFNGPNWIKSLVTIAVEGPNLALAMPRPLQMIQEDVEHFLNNYV